MHLPSSITKEAPRVMEIMSKFPQLPGAIRIQIAHLRNISMTTIFCAQFMPKRSDLICGDCISFTEIRNNNVFSPLTSSLPHTPPRYEETACHQLMEH